MQSNISIVETDVSGRVPCPDAIVAPDQLPPNIQIGSGRWVNEDEWPLVNVSVRDGFEVPPGLADWILTIEFELISLRLVNMLREYRCDCQYLPVAVVYNGKSIPNEYFALNGLKVLTDAVDVKSSKMEEYDEEFNFAYGIEYLVLRGDIVKQQPLVFLREIARFAMRDDLAAAIVKAGMVGPKFRPPEDFRN